jgi:thymidylate kinase
MPWLNRLMMTRSLFLKVDDDVVGTVEPETQPAGRVGKPGLALLSGSGSSPLWIILEGLDGAGKTHAMDWVYQHLFDKLCSVYRVSETSVLHVADGLRSGILRTALQAGDPFEAFAHFVSARFLMRREIKASALYDLGPDTVFVRDRSFLSTFAYQGWRMLDAMGSSLDDSSRADWERFLFMLLSRSDPAWSDRAVLIYLDVDPDVSWRRIQIALDPLVEDSDPVPLMPARGCYNRRIADHERTAQYYKIGLDYVRQYLPNWSVHVVDANCEWQPLMDNLIDIVEQEVLKLDEA